MGFDKYMMMHTQLYRIIQSSLTVLKIPCAPASHKSLVTNDLYCLHSFVFSGMSYSQNHTICRLFKWFPPVGHMNLRFLHICSGEGNGRPSSTVAWKIPWTEEPGRLQSMGSWRVWHNWATALSLFPFMHWKRKWQPTPVFLPGESRDRGAWWAAIYGVTQGCTRLTWLSSSSSNISVVWQFISF